MILTIRKQTCSSVILRDTCDKCKEPFCFTVGKELLSSLATVLLLFVSFVDAAALRSRYSLSVNFRCLPFKKAKNNYNIKPNKKSKFLNKNFRPKSKKK